MYQLAKMLPQNLLLESLTSMVSKASSIIGTGILKYVQISSVLDVHNGFTILYLDIGKW